MNRGARTRWRRGRELRNSWPICEFLNSAAVREEYIPGVMLMYARGWPLKQRARKNPTIRVSDESCERTPSSFIPHIMSLSDLMMDSSINNSTMAAFVTSARRINPVSNLDGFRSTSVCGLASSTGTSGEFARENSMTKRCSGISSGRLDAGVE